MHRLDRVRPLAVVRRARPLRQQRQILNLFLALEHLDRVRTHARVRILEHAIQDRVRCRCQFAEHADRFAAQLAVRIVADLKQHRPQWLRQLQLVRHLHCLEPIRERPREKPPRKSLHTVRQHFEHRLAGILSRRAIQIIKPLPVMIEPALSDRARHDAPHRLRRAGH